jgi:hypothetical protein
MNNRDHGQSRHGDDVGKIDRPSVFISHAHEDNETARGLTKELNRKGFSVWFDERELKSGEAWEQQIKDAISGCNALLLLVSKKTMLSNIVLAEVGMALGQGKRVIPIMVEDQDEQVRAKVFENFDLSGNFEDGLHELAKVLQKGRQADQK